MSPFEALFGYKPSLLPALLGHTNVAMVDEHLQQRQGVLRQLKVDLAMAQNRMKQQADKGRSEREFAVGDKVYLKLKGPHLKSLTTGPISKLTLRYFGLFPIVAKIGKVAYRLQLPKNTNIHSVFHVSVLKKAMEGQQVESLLLAEIIGDIGPPEPAAIVDKQVLYRHGAPITQVLVKWTNRQEEDNT